MNIQGPPNPGTQRRFRWLGRGLLVTVVLTGSVAGTYALIRSVETPRTPKRIHQDQRVSSPNAGLPRGSAVDLPSGWIQLPPPPEVRVGAASAWTGDQLIVWGGYVYSGYSDESAARDGFVFDADSRSWQPIAESPLDARSDAASAWTGSEMLVWGGGTADGTAAFADGAAYDPATDSWRLLPPAPLGPRVAHSVWTGRDFIVWGSSNRDDRRRDGAAYDPSINQWRRIADAVISLTDAAAVWTGSEMVIFGAALHGGNFAETKTAIGAAYDPTSNTWRRIADSELSPQASTAAWDGNEVIAWDYEHRSAAWDPNVDRWRRLGRVPLDAMECSPRALSLEGFIFGDYCGQMALFEPREGVWREVRPPLEASYSGWTLVPADPAVVLLGRNVDTGEQHTLAYRPPKN